MGDELKWLLKEGSGYMYIFENPLSCRPIPLEGRPTLFESRPTQVSRHNRYYGKEQNSSKQFSKIVANLYKYLAGCLLLAP